MMSVKSCWRVHVPFLTMTQWVLFSSWNKHFTVNFKHRNMAAIKCQEQSYGNAEDVFMSWLPCCTRASAWWVTNVWNDSLSGTSPPARRSTPVTIKVQSAELVWRSCTTDQMHENAENIPSTWLLLMLGRELFSSANLLTTEKLRTSVYCPTNTLCTTYFPLTVFDIFFASEMISLSSTTLSGWCAGMEAASTMMSAVPISARHWRMKVFMAVSR